MSKLYSSLLKATKHNEPWEYFTFGQCLTPQQIDEIKTADINRTQVLNDGTRSGYRDGVGKQNDKFREYITKENAGKYPELVKFITELQTEGQRFHLWAAEDGVFWRQAGGVSR